jgi:hypothetical protein
MAVAFDAANGATGNGTTASVAVTCAASSMVLVCFFVNNNPTISTVTFDGNAMTLVWNASTINGDGFRVYRYTGHAAGSRTAQVTWTGAQDWGIGVVSVTGQDGTTPVGTIQTINNDGLTSITTPSITGATDGLFVDAVMMVNGNITPGASQTQRVTNTESINGGAVSIAMSTKAGAASTTMSWTAPETFGFNYLVGIPILAAAGGSTVTKTPTTGNLSLGGLVSTNNAFNFVRIREVLINESGQAVASAANIRLMVWYAGQCRGAPDVSLNSMTTDTNGTISWSIPTGSLVKDQPIFYVAQDSISFSNYTAARMTPSYE